MRKRKPQGKLDFIPNRNNKYSIRRFTVGTASILIGATLVFGINNDAKAAETNDTQSSVSANDSQSSNDDPNNSTTSHDTSSQETAHDPQVNNDANQDNQASQESNTEESTQSSQDSNGTAQPSSSQSQASDNQSNPSQDDVDQPASNADDVHKSDAAQATTDEDRADNSDSDDETSNDDSQVNETEKQDQADDNSAKDDVDKQGASDGNSSDENAAESDKEQSSDDAKDKSANEAKDDSQSSTDDKSEKDSQKEEHSKKGSNKAESDSESDSESQSTKSKSGEDQPEEKQDDDKSGDDQADEKSDDKSSDKETESDEDDSDSVEQGKDKSDNETQETKDTKASDSEKKKDKLQSKLDDADSNDKEDTVNDYLKDQLGGEQAKSVLEDADIDYDKDSNATISDKVLKSALIQFANQKDKNSPQAIRPGSAFFSAYSTEAVTRAAKDTKVAKSLGYENNYTFSQIMFDPDSLDSDEAKKSTTIPFKIHSYLTSDNSLDRYKIDLDLDSRLAKHVTKISARPVGGDKPVEFKRLKDENGEPSDIWEVNFIRAQGGLFGGAEILATYTAEDGKIELDDSIENIIKEENLDKDKLNYRVYVRNNETNKIIRTAENSGYFLTDVDKELTDKEKDISTANKGSFLGNSGAVQYDQNIGEHGGLTVDQTIMKNSIFDYILYAGNKQWTYNYQIDKDLLPYISGAELHLHEYKGLAGFDKEYHERDKVADLSFDKDGKGSITDRNMNRLIEFNNSNPEPIGIRIVLKFNQNPNNILTKDAEYDDDGNLIRETVKQKELFNFNGYLTDNKGKLINNTHGTSTLAIQDYDRDGLLDNYERQNTHSDPFNPDTDGDGKNDGDEVVNYKTSPLVGQPKASDITTEDTVVSGSVPLKDGAAAQTAKVINSDGETVGTGTVNSDGSFSVNIPKSPEGTYTIAIDSPDYENDETNTFKIVDTSKVPAPTINPVNDKDNEVIVNGTGGSTVTVRDKDGNTVGTVDIPDGQSSGTIHLDNPLKAGTELTSTASKNGKESDPSDTVTVDDKTAPNQPTIDEVTTNNTSISGKAEAGSTVHVKLPNGDTVSAKANDEGAYSVDLPKDLELNGGDNITVTSEDDAGNISESNSTKVINKRAPEAPTIKPVSSEDNSLTGTAKVNTTVTVEFPDGSTLDTKADDQGNYTINLGDKKLDGRETLKVTATEDGNTSPATTTVVKDDTAPDAPTVDDVGSEDKIVEGTAEPNSIVTVHFPNGTSVESHAGKDGRYNAEIPSDLKLKGGEKITATAKDIDGNVSKEGSTTVEDNTAPDVPTVVGVNSTDKEVTGTAEPGSEVTVHFPDNKTGTATADDNGKYTVKIPDDVTLKGGENIDVTAKDKNSNVSEPAHTVVSDKTAPDAPEVEKVNSNGDKVTGTAEPGSTVKVTFPNGKESEGKADDQGNFSVDIPKEANLKGGEQLNVVAVDDNDNTSAPTSVTVGDKTAPDAPTVDDVKSTDKTVTGEAEPGSTVKVSFPGNKTGTATADDNGKYTVEIPEDVELNGDDEISVTAADKDGNTSDAKTVTVTDTTAPDKPSVDDVTSDSKHITGQAEPKSTVTVTFPDGTTATGETDDNGHYSVDIPENIDLKGEEELNVTATDKAGNTSQAETKTVTDTTAPEIPKVDGVTSADKHITGTAEPNSHVKVTFPDGTTATGETDKDGNFTVDIPSKVDLKGGEELTVTATDANDNESTPAKLPVADKTAPNKPSVEGVNSTDKEVTGKAEPGSEVTVKFPGNKTGTATADDDGNYTVKIPDNVDLQGGEELEVTATDKAGNTSDATTTTVADKTAPDAPSAEDVNSEDDAIKGKAEPGSEVTVNIPGHDPITGTADDEGNYNIDLPKDLQGGEEITVTAKDKDGNVSGETKKTVTDATAPNKPSVKGVNSTDKEVTGTAEPGSTVTVKFPDGTTSTGTADDNGNYTVEIPDEVKLSGGEELEVTATDKAGNTSDKATTTVADKTAPDAPTADDVNSEDDAIKGKAEPGSEVTVNIPGHDPITGTADDEGNYNIDLPKDLQGGEELTVTAKDKDGNVSGETKKTVADATAPAKPSVKGVNSTDKEVTGTAEPGSTVTVTFPDGTTSTGTADDDGNYTVKIPDDVDLQGGEELEVTATDKAGNTSEKATTTVADKTAPDAPTANDVNSEDKQLTGKAEPGSEVTVDIPGHDPIKGAADQDGNYSIDLPTDLQGGEEITVTAKDKDGNVSGETKKTVTDATAPAKPSVEGVNSTDKEVTGTAEPGSTVTVKFPGNKTGTATADEDGKYTVEIPDEVKLSGGEELEVTATDKAGNTSDKATTTVADKTAPDAPTADDITSESPSVKGKAEPVSTITVNMPGHDPITGTVDDNGNYEIDLPKDLQGGEEVTIRATDKDGNVSSETKKTVTDTTAPVKPSVNGVSSTDKEVTGQAEPGSEVTVHFPDGTTSKATADRDGNYSVEVPDSVNLKGGEELEVTATDKAGNTSDKATTTVSDKTAPDAPTADEITSESPSVKGTAEPGSTITVNIPGHDPITGTADDNGNYTIELPKTLNGGEELEVTATDKAGNTSDAATTTVTDTTAPTEPTVNGVNSTDKAITGHAEPGSTVTVTFPDGTTATGTADDDGNYTIEIPDNVKLNGGETVSVTATDKDGNTSNPTSVTVADTTAPTTPTINDIHHDDTQISGHAEPGSTVTVTFPDGTTATGTADDQGNYIIDIPSNVNLKPGDTVTVTATDKDGNTSDLAEVTVQEGNNVDPGNSGSGDQPVDPGNNSSGDQPADPSTNNGGNNNNSDDNNNHSAGNNTDQPAHHNNTGSNSTNSNQPTAPAVNPIGQHDHGISGQNATPGNTIVATFPDGSTATTTVNNDGTWNITVPANTHFNNGDTVQVVEQDASGHTSNTTSVVVGDNHVAQGNDQDTADLPDTGNSESNKGTIFGTLFAALGAIFLFGRRRKDKKDEE
ncbi:Ig-like domain-containing protein [Staphylococcus pettenkoferi]|uniref:Ig-like domain-containing protein n=1 Tax=Staphylococcus pettenkoferi TaxID=170573 RepID=UPI002274844D|nr:Ig-like domain-containing protein [Staphylococcus pettenkoferi]MCY1565070.1 Ig-like domain-containing protein [Staphylococcus pettenkoferi]